MPDISSVQPVSGLGNAVRPTPPRPEPAVKPPAKSDDAALSADNGHAGHQHAATKASLDAADLRPRDEHILTGPPPTFEASLLEVESDLDAVLRRIEARRELQKAQETISLTAPEVSPTDTVRPTGTIDAPDAAARSDATSEAAIHPAEPSMATTDSTNPLDG